MDRVKENQGIIAYIIGSKIAEREIKKLKKKLKIKGETIWEKWMSAPVQEQSKNNL